MAATRRTLLAGLALPAAAGGFMLPAVLAPTVAAEPHPDAELLRLGQRWVENRVAFDTAIDRAAELQEVGRPEGPATFVAANDHLLGLAGYASQRADGRRWYYVEPADSPLHGLRRRHWREEWFPASPGDGLPEDAQGTWRRVPWPEAQARADEIVAAWDGWRAARQAAWDASGYTAAYAVTQHLSATEAELQHAIEALTPRTLAGLVVQARVYLGDLAEENEDEPEAAVLLRRFVAMQGGAA